MYFPPLIYLSRASPLLHHLLLSCYSLVCMALDPFGQILGWGEKFLACSA